MSSHSTAATACGKNVPGVIPFLVSHAGEITDRRCGLLRPRDSPVILLAHTPWTLLAPLDTRERVEEVVSPICRRHTSKGKSIRAIRPWSEPDQRLPAAVAACGLAGDFRNRDIAARLYPHSPAQEVSGKVTYLLRLLREHKIIRRLPNTRKYRLTPTGAKIIATIFLTQKATTEQLDNVAA